MFARRPALSLALAVAFLASTAPGAFATPARIRMAVPSAVSIAPTPSQRSAESTRVADDRLIVRVKGAVTADKLTSIYHSADTSAGALRVIRRDTLSWRAPAGTSPAEFAEQLERSGQVEFASPNYLRYPTGYTPPAFSSPNDPAYTDAHTWELSDGSQTYPYAKSWWIRNVNAINGSSTNAWRRGYTGASITGKHPLRADGDAIKVAVIDTGYYFDHPDAGTNVEAGTADATPVNPSQGPYTGTNAVLNNTMEVSHGTCVAGEIAAATNNGVGTLGVGNDTKVRVYKVYFGGRGIEDSDVIDAIYRAVDDGCKVINMSLAGPDRSSALQSACDYAYSEGCVIVAASGNNGGSTVYYPAACDHVIGVGSVGLKGNGTSHARSAFSNGGSKLDLVAPGEFIWGLVKPGYVADDNSEAGYTWWQGTSMASPIVAGGIAWLWRAMPSLSNASILSIVQSTARDLGSHGRDNSYGYGELDMDAAYAKLIANYPLLKKPTTLSAIPSDNARDQRISWNAVSGYHVTYDIAVDGDVVLSGLTKTSAVLPHDTTPGPHTVTVSPVSRRNWTDGTASASVLIDPTESVPQVLPLSLRYRRGTLSWSDTEIGTVHTDLLSIDGGPAVTLTGETTSTSGLSQGSHTASLTVRDNDLVDSAPATLTFTVREAPSVKRVTASDAAGYAAALSARRTASATTAVLVGTGTWTNAVIAAPLARVVDGPVLVTGSNSLSSAAKVELKRLGATDVIIVGSTHAVGTSVTSQLRALGYHLSRVTGSDRYAAANAVAREIALRSGGTIPDGRAVVVGDSASDAFSASAVAAHQSWPLMFAGSKSVSSATRSTLQDLGVTSTLLVASTSSVSNTAKGQLPSAQRITSASSAGVGVVLARWATITYPADFSGERVFLANPGAWDKNLGLGAAAARENALVLTTGKTISGAVKAHYTDNSEVAVRTRVVGGSSTIADSVVTAIKKLVGAP